MFNVATVLTLVVGASCLYVALIAVNLVTGLVILDGGVLERTIGRPADFGVYAAVAWLASSLATVGGTLGSGLQDRVEVREAAYAHHPERLTQREGGDRRSPQSPSGRRSGGP